MAKVCIICEKEIAPGATYYKVKDDAIIKTIRGVKQRLGIARNNELCVDQACLGKYRDKRKKFERNIVFYVALGVIVFVLINGLQLMSGSFSVIAFIASLFLAVLISGLAILNYATPPIDELATIATESQHIQEEEEHAGHGHASEDEWASEDAAKKAKPRKGRK